MTRESIYKTSDGHTAVRSYCEQQLAAWPRPHHSTVLETSLGPTHVVRSGSGRPVVVLPGTNFSAAVSLALVDALSTDLEVHALDLPGQPGLSHDVRPPDVVGSYGRWVAELLPQLTERPPLVIGHSLGGLVAMAGVAHGAEVAGLLLIDPAGLMRLRVTVPLLRATLGWLRTPEASTSEQLLAKMMAAGAAPDPALTDWMTLVGRHVRTSLAPRPMSDRDLAQLTGVATTVLNGRHDLFLPPRPLTRTVRSRLPAAEMVLADHAGHLVPHERPDAVRTVVTEAH